MKQQLCVGFFLLCWLCWVLNGSYLNTIWISYVAYMVRIVFVYCVCLCCKQKIVCVSFVKSGRQCFIFFIVFVVLASCCMFHWINTQLEMCYEWSSKAENLWCKLCNNIKNMWYLSMCTNKELSILFIVEFWRVFGFWFLVFGFWFLVFGFWVVSFVQ